MSMKNELIQIVGTNVLKEIDGKTVELAQCCLYLEIQLYSLAHAYDIPHEDIDRVFAEAKDILNG